MLLVSKLYELFSLNHLNNIYEKYYFEDDQDINVRAVNVKKEYIRYFILERVSI